MLSSVKLHQSTNVDEYYSYKSKFFSFYQSSVDKFHQPSSFLVVVLIVILFWTILCIIIWFQETHSIPFLFLLQLISFLFMFLISVRKFHLLYSLSSYGSVSMRVFIRFDIHITVFVGRQYCTLSRFYNSREDFRGMYNFVRKSEF